MSQQKSRTHILKTALWTLIAGGILPGTALAQDCGCDIVIPAATTFLDGNTVARVGGGTGVQPGDKICLMAGTKPSLFVKNLVGSAAEPLLITNCGGKVLIGPDPLVTPLPDTAIGLPINSSRHFVLSGKGDPAHRYGIYVRGTTGGRSGIALGTLSEYFRVEGVEVSHTAFAGIMSKTDPRCDLSANRGVWTQHETYFHDNYIHDTGGEGFYVGHTSYGGYNTTCNGVSTTLYPHVIEGVGITANRVERAGWDGIQLSSAPLDANVSGNTVEDFGLEARFGQQQGIQIGSGTTGWVDGNVIKDGTGNGIEMHGLGDNFIVNNLIVRPDGRGVYLGNWGAEPGKGFFLFNNTIIEPGSHGIQMLNVDGTGNAAYNNLIVGPDRIAGTSPEVCISVGSGVDWTASNNLCADDPAEEAAVLFVNAAADDYHLQAGSTAVDAGLDLTAEGVTEDLEGTTRPQGAAFDAGAYERGSGTGSGPVVFQQDFQSSTSVASYVNATSPDTGQLNDISAEATGGTWSINQGRLRLVRTGSSATDNDAGLTRHTDFAGTPTLLHVTFDLGASAWTNSPYQTGAFILSVGSLSAFSDYGNGDVAANTFQSMTVNGKGPGQLAFATAGLESAVLATDGTLHTVAFFLNKSGAAASYRAPDGTLRNLRANGAALWVDETAVVADAAATNGSSSTLTDLRVRFTNPDNATWTLDNFVIRSAFPQ
jgi:hypothetical protein